MPEVSAMELFEGLTALHGGPLDDASGYIAFRVLFEHLDGMVRQFGIDFFGRAMAWVSVAAGTLFTLWLLIEGYRILTGRSQQSLTAFTGDMTRAAVIASIASGAYLGSDTLYDWVNRDLGDMVHRVVTGQTGDVFEGIDRMLGYMQMAFGFIDEIQTGDSGVLRDAKYRNLGFVAVGMGGPAVVAGALLLMYKVMLALCLGFAPLFVLCLLFPQTKTLFWGWLNYLVGTLFALSVLHVMAAIAVNMICAVAATFWTAKLTGASVEGVNSLAMQQGGLGLILTTLIIGAPAAAAKFFKGLLGDFNPYSAFGHGGAARASTVHTSPPHMQAHAHADPGERQQAPVQTHAHRVIAPARATAYEDQIKPAEDTRSFLERYPNATTSLDGRIGKGDPIPEDVLSVATSNRVATSYGFGKEVDPLISLSPTLTENIDKLMSEGWTFSFGKSNKGSYTERNTTPRQVVIDQNKQGNVKEILRALTHEVGHATYPYRPDYSSKQAYVAGTLQDEAAALLKNIEIRREILAASDGKIDIGINALAANHDTYNAIYDRYKIDGDKVAALKEIAAIYGRRETARDPSGEVVSYEEYYGEWYDKKYGR